MAAQTNLVAVAERIGLPFDAGLRRWEDLQEAVELFRGEATHGIVEHGGLVAWERALGPAPAVALLERLGPDDFGGRCEEIVGPGAGSAGWVLAELRAMLLVAAPGTADTGAGTPGPDGRGGSAGLPPAGGD